MLQSLARFGGMLVLYPNNTAESFVHLINLGGLVAAVCLLLLPFLRRSG